MDDTDVLLGSSDIGLPQTRQLIGDAGAIFSNFLTHSPKCTPSRTGQLVGRHYHNVRPSGWQNATFGGGLNQTTMFEATGLFPMLHSNGYLTSIVGKVHNGQKSWLCTKQNRTECFDHISTQCSPCGNFYGNEYVEKSIHDSVPNMAPPLDPAAWETYSHGQFGNRSLNFMRRAVAQNKRFSPTSERLGPISHRYQHLGMRTKCAPGTIQFLFLDMKASIENRKMHTRRWKTCH